jgi:hypothetical protein
MDAREVDWPGYDRLKAEGRSGRQIAQLLGLPESTLRSALARRQARGHPPEPPPVQRPVQTSDTGAVSRVDTGAVQPFDTGPVQRLDALEQEVQGLRLLMQSVLGRLDHPPVQTPVQITTLPPYPKGKAVRWNLWISDVIKDRISAMAAERQLSPSELVQEYLWKALTATQAAEGEARP